MVHCLLIKVLDIWYTFVYYYLERHSRRLLESDEYKEKSDKWLEKVSEYINNPADTNEEAIKEIQSIALEHQVDEYLASLLYASKV